MGRLEDDIENARSIAEQELSGAYTIEVKLWETDEYQIEAFHTIDTPDTGAENVIRERILFWSNNDGDVVKYQKYTQNSHEALDVNIEESKTLQSPLQPH